MWGWIPCMDVLIRTERLAQSLMTLRNWTNGPSSQPHKYLETTLSDMLNMTLSQIYDPKYQLDKNINIT